MNRQDWGKEKQSSVLNLQIGRTISVYRCAKSMSLAELAQATGLERRRLRLIEHGGTSATATEVITIAHAYGLHPSFLISVALKMPGRWNIADNLQSFLD